ncbi:hypothetical protein V5799_034186 [Amblyomma americanum]|uniref:Uncharacterized protein n=1 Tax=Amblyomma americanum TaxID=6943 RepID=A0AAQ4DL60_AMBAM
MDFYDQSEKAFVTGAIADALDQSSSTSVEEYVKGAPLDVEAQKLEEEQRRMEEEARNQEEQMRKEREEEERRLEKKKKDEEEARRLKRQQEKERRLEEERRIEDERQLDEERRLEEERKEREKAKAPPPVGKHDKADTAPRKPPVRKKSEALPPAPDDAESLQLDTGKTESGFKKAVMDMMADMEAKAARDREMKKAVATADASTETIGEISFTGQASKQNQEVQAGPTKLPVASYVVRSRQSENNLQRLLSFFGLANPHERDQEVTEYEFHEPSAIWSPARGRDYCYEDRGGRRAWREGYERRRKGGRKARKRWDYDEESESESSSDEFDLRDKDARERRSKPRHHRKGRRSDHWREDREEGRRHLTEQPDQPETSSKKPIRQSAQKLQGVGFVEEVTEEVVEPQQGPYGQPLGPRLRRTRVVRPLDALPSRTAGQQAGTYPSSSRVWKTRLEQPTGGPWEGPDISKQAEQPAMDSQDGLPGLGFLALGTGVQRQQVPPVSPFPRQQWRMPHTEGFYDPRQPYFPDRSVYPDAQQMPCSQHQYISPGCTLGKFAFAYRQNDGSIFDRRPVAKSASSICTCVVKCGDHCIGLGRKKSECLRPKEPYLGSSGSLRGSLDYERRRPSEDFTRIEKEDTLRLHADVLWAEGRKRDDFEAKIRAEQEARWLRSQLRLLQEEHQEEKARLEERREEEELRLERQVLQDELDRIKERRQAEEWRQRQDMTQMQMARMQERLRVLENAQEDKNQRPERSTWSRDRVPAMIPFFMPLPYAPLAPYGFPPQYAPSDWSAGWRHQHCCRGRRCSEAGNDSPKKEEYSVGFSAKLGKSFSWKSGDRVAKEQQDAPQPKQTEGNLFAKEKEDASQPEQTEGNFFAKEQQDASQPKQTEGNMPQTTPLLGRLIPFFTSFSAAKEPSEKHVSYEPNSSEPDSKPEPVAGTMNLSTESSSGEQVRERQNEQPTPTRRLAPSGGELGLNIKEKQYVEDQPDVPQVQFVQHRKSVCPRRKTPKDDMPSRARIAMEVDSLLTQTLSDIEMDIPKPAKRKVILATSAGKRAEERESSSSRAQFPEYWSSTSHAKSSDFSAARPKARKQSKKSASTASTLKGAWSLTGAGSRLFGALSAGSSKANVEKRAPVAHRPVVKPRTLPLLVTKKESDDSPGWELDAATEDPYASDNFLKKSFGMPEAAREASDSRTIEVGSSQPNDPVSVEETTKSVPSDAKSLSAQSAPKPPQVSVTEVVKVGGEKSVLKQSESEKAELGSEQQAPADNPVDIPEQEPHLSEELMQSAESAQDIDTLAAENAVRKEGSAPAAEDAPPETNTDAPDNQNTSPDPLLEDAPLETKTDAPDNQNAFPAPLLVIPSAEEEAAAEKEMFELTETARDFYPERSCVAILSALTLLWIAVVFSSTTLMSVNVSSSSTTPETTISETTGTPSITTTRLPDAYLCDSDYCTREGNFLKSLLSEANYPCEDFYQHVCQRWKQRRSSEVFRAGVLSEDALLEDRMERNIMTFFMENAGTVGPAPDFLKACEISASSSSVHHVQEVFKQWKIREWPIPTYKERLREDAWFFAGELLRDLGLSVFTDIYVAVDPLDARQGVTTLRPPEPLHFPIQIPGQSSLVGSAIEETVRAFGVTDPKHGERLVGDIMLVFELLERAYLSADYDNATMLKSCDLDGDVFKLVSVAVESKLKRARKSTSCFDLNHVLLLSAKYFKRLPAEIREVRSPNAVLNHLGFRAMVRLAAFLPQPLQALRQLSFLEATGRTDVPNADSLCLRMLERAFPLCFVSAATLPLQRSGTALWQRRWLSDLEVTFLRALPRVSWIDVRALFALSFRLRRIRVDGPFAFGKVQENSSCYQANQVPGHSILDLLHMLRKRRARETARDLRFGPGWRPISPLNSWPDLDAPGRNVRVPQGILNDSVPANSSLFAFHLPRVAVRFYASMVPLLYSSFVFDREAALDLGVESERRLETTRRCLDDDWQALTQQETLGTPLYVLLDRGGEWLRRWLLEQTLAIELALHAFRELLDVRRVWKLEYRFVTLPKASSTQLFFLYYALDNCQQDDEAFEQRQMLLRRQPPPAMRVNMPLRHIKAFADAFSCSRESPAAADDVREQRARWYLECDEYDQCERRHEAHWAIVAALVASTSIVVAFFVFVALAFVARGDVTVHHREDRTTTAEHRVAQLVAPALNVAAAARANFYIAHLEIRDARVATLPLRNVGGCLRHSTPYRVHTRRRPGLG